MGVPSGKYVSCMVSLLFIVMSPCHTYNFGLFAQKKEQEPFLTPVPFYHENPVPAPKMSCSSCDVLLLLMLCVHGGKVFIHLRADTVDLVHQAEDEHQHKDHDRQKIVKEYDGVIRGG